MPDTPTTRLALPRPSGGDDDFPPQDFAALAARLDLIAAADDQGPYSAIGSPTGKRGFYYYATNATGPGLFRSDGTDWRVIQALAPTLTSVPTPLYDGQRFAYRPDATNQPSVRWTFVRQDGQWLLESGNPLVSVSSSVASWESTAFAGFVAGGCTAPLAGDYSVTAQCHTTSDGRGIAILFKQGVGASLVDARWVADATTTDFGNRTFVETGVPAGQVFQFAHRVASGTTVSTDAASTFLLPIRVI